MTPNEHMAVNDSLQAYGSKWLPNEHIALLAVNNT